jgi:hypothetical protein
MHGSEAVPAQIHSGDLADCRHAVHRRSVFLRLGGCQLGQLAPHLPARQNVDLKGEGVIMIFKTCKLRPRNFGVVHENIRVRAQLWLNTYSRTLISRRKPLSWKFSVLSDSFHSQTVQYSAGLSCKRELYASMIPSSLSKFDRK